MCLRGSITYDLCSHFYFTRTPELSPAMGQGRQDSVDREGRAGFQEAGPAEGGHAGGRARTGQAWRRQGLSSPSRHGRSGKEMDGRARTGTETLSPAPTAADERSDEERGPLPPFLLPQVPHLRSGRHANASVKSLPAIGSVPPLLLRGLPPPSCPSSEGPGPGLALPTSVEPAALCKVPAPAKPTAATRLSCFCLQVFCSQGAVYPAGAATPF